MFSYNLCRPLNNCPGGGRMVALERACRTLPHSLLYLLPKSRVHPGKREGDAVVLLYWAGLRATSADDGMTSVLPQLKLVGFKRVSLEAGARATVSFEVTAEELALFDDNGDAKLFAGSHTLLASLGSPDAPTDAPAGDTMERVFVVQGTETLRKLEW
eukprot:COSAG03_NODE_1278_length_4415_cov_2.649444_7_plen_158_part_00